MSEMTPESEYLRRQFRWWREGGFRWPWMARLSGGRYGLGTWTRRERADIDFRSRERYLALLEYLEGSDAEEQATSPGAST